MLLEILHDPQWPHENIGVTIVLLVQACLALIVPRCTAEFSEEGSAWLALAQESNMCKVNSTQQVMLLALCHVVKSIVWTILLKPGSYRAYE